MTVIMFWLLSDRHGGKPRILRSVPSRKAVVTNRRRTLAIQGAAKRQTVVRHLCRKNVAIEQSNDIMVTFRRSTRERKNVRLAIYRAVQRLQRCPFFICGCVLFSDRNRAEEHGCTLPSLYLQADLRIINAKENCTDVTVYFGNPLYINKKAILIIDGTKSRNFEKSDFPNFLKFWKFSNIIFWEMKILTCML